jgi:hypothetical protein
MLILAKDRQLMLEEQFSKKGIDSKLREHYVNDPEVVTKLNQGVEILRAWSSQEFTYQSKTDRIDQIKDLDFYELVMSVFIGVGYYEQEELFTGVSAMLAGRLGMNDKLDAIKTCAEIIAVLSLTQAYKIEKPSKYSPVFVVSQLSIPEALRKDIAMKQYLPPMITMPEDIRHNRDDPHLTYNESLILGKGNHHDGDICLDFINKKNQVALSIDTDFVSSVEEEPKNEPKTVKELQNWNRFKCQSYLMYHLMVKQGNEFYLCNRPDFRGRSYAQGYHISTQGTSFKKAMLELHKKDVVEGVPSKYKLSINEKTQSEPSTVGEEAF